MSDCLINRGSLEPFLGLGRPGRLPGRMELKWNPKGKPNEGQMEPKSADPSGLCVRPSERFTSPPTPPPPWPPGAALQKPLFFSRFSRENALNAYAEGSSGGPRGGVLKPILHSIIAPWACLGSLWAPLWCTIYEKRSFSRGFHAKTLPRGCPRGLGGALGVFLGSICSPWAPFGCLLPFGWGSRWGLLWGLLFGFPSWVPF